MAYVAGALFGLSLIYIIALAMIHIINNAGLVMTRTSIRQAPSPEADHAMDTRALEYQRELEKKWLRLSPLAIIAAIAAVTLLVISAV